MVRGVAVLVLMAGGVVAQPATRRVTGVAHDVTGAVIPGATISLPDASSAAWKTNDRGVFVLDQAPGGTFHMRVEAPGFKAKTVEVPAGSDAVAVTLEIGYGKYPPDIVVLPNWVSPCEVSAGGLTGPIEVRGAVKHLHGGLSVGDASCAATIPLAPADDTVRQHLAMLSRALKTQPSVTATITGVLDPLKRRILVDSISLR